MYGKRNDFVARNKHPEETIERILDVSLELLDEENEQLKKLLGEKDLEIAILRDLLKKRAKDRR